jgi:RND family efflux transporter MFP subunit
MKISPYGAGVALLLTLATLAYTQGSSPSAKPPAARPTPQVSVVRAEQRDLAVLLEGQGHIVPLNLVDIRPQLTATIRSVDFHEGDQVRAGQLLFTLDATDADAQLHRAEAQAAQIQAQLDDGRRELTRSRELLKEEFISPSAVDTVASKVDTLSAQLRAARADIDSAHVLRDHTRISAPISGLAGAVAVHPGSLAQNATAPLVTLVQLDPIGVEFTLPEQELPRVLAARAAGPVAVMLDAPDGQRVAGTLSFVDNSVNKDTGTIRLKASFANPAHALWPGAYTRVTVAAGTNTGAILLPPQALLEGPDGRFVYVVDTAGKAQAKPVRLLRVQERMAVVEGIAGGTAVVLEGNQNLRAGSQVRVAAAEKSAAKAADRPTDKPKEKP